MSIRKKLFLMAMTVFAAIILMMGAVWMRASGVLKDFLNSAGTEIITHSAQNLKRQFNKVAALLQVASETLRHSYTDFVVTDEDELEQIATALLQRVKGEGVYDLYLGHVSTGRLSSGTRWKEPADYDARNRGWYRLATEAPKGTVIFTGPYIDAETKKMVITAAVAIHDKLSRLIGVAAADVQLDEQNEYISHLSIFGHGSGMALDRNGLVLMSSRQEDNLKVNFLTDPNLDPSLRAVAQQIVSGKTGFSRFTRDGEEFQMFYAPVGYGFFLGVSFPYSVIKGIVWSLTSVILLVALIALVITGFVIYRIVLTLSRAVRSMTRVTRSLAEGELLTRFDAHGGDELAQISRSMNEMLDNFCSVLTDIRASALETAEESETLAGLSQETFSSMKEAEGAVEMVNSLIGETAASLDEATATIENIAKGAEETSQKVSEGAQQADQLDKAAGSAINHVESSLEGMNSASRESQLAGETISKLDESVSAISGFVTTITGIADQTNLLALNAAIEAARAGEAGRGFAVVAEEVRKLAEESAGAAQQVSCLIAELQKGSADSIQATENTAKILVEGVERSERVRTEFREALSATGSLSGSIQDIAVVARQQAVSSKEAALSVAESKDAVQKISSSGAMIRNAVHETTQAAESITEMSQRMAEASDELLRLLEHFTLQEKGNAKETPKDKPKGKDAKPLPGR